MTSDERRGDWTLTADGTFDVRAARRIAAALEGALRDHVRVDLTRVQQFDDFGIAVLAQAVKHLRGVRVTIAGLRRHQLRVLEYFGVDPDSVTPRRPRDPSADEGPP